MAAGEPPFGRVTASYGGRLGSCGPISQAGSPLRARGVGLRPLTSEQIEAFIRRTLRELGGLAAPQRGEVIERTLRADDQLAPVLDELLATVARARCVRRLSPLIRDSVN